MNFKQLLSLFCDFFEKNTFISHEISFIVNYVDIEIWSDAVQLSFHQFSLSETKMCNIWLRLYQTQYTQIVFILLINIKKMLMVMEWKYSIRNEKWVTTGCSGHNFSKHEWSD